MFNNTATEWINQRKSECLILMYIWCHWKLWGIFLHYKRHLRNYSVYPWMVKNCHAKDHDVFFRLPTCCRLYSFCCGKHSFNHDIILNDKEIIFKVCSTRHTYIHTRIIAANLYLWSNNYLFKELQIVYYWKRYTVSCLSVPSLTGKKHRPIYSLYKDLALNTLSIYNTN